jgi:hypothetical protein
MAHPCSQTAVAWVGAIIHMLDRLGVCVLTSQEKWAKMQGILAKWKSALWEDSPNLSHKELLANQGLLVYVTRTYLAMVPFLKGFHITIEMWQGGRDAKGWKLKGGNDSSVSFGMDLDKAASYAPLSRGDKDEAVVVHWLASKTRVAHTHAPMDRLTTPIPRFKDDIDTLLQVTNFEIPPLRMSDQQTWSIILLMWGRLGEAVKSHSL